MDQFENDEHDDKKNPYIEGGGEWRGAEVEKVEVVLGVPSPKK